jgi:hypothetical protein
LEIFRLYYYEYSRKSVDFRKTKNDSILITGKKGVIEMEIIQKLKQEEGRAIVEGLAALAYNSSLGYGLDNGGVGIFVELVAENIKRIEGIVNQDEFDNFHGTIIASITDRIKTIQGEAPSYGQAQRPLNVFLRVFVDWAGRPSTDKANQLRKLLHVPLDSVLMEEIKNNFPDELKKYVVAPYDLIRQNFKIGLRESGEKVNDALLRQIINPYNFSLEGIISKEMYIAWQQCLRAIYPEKPILLDVLWLLKQQR